MIIFLELFRTKLFFFNSPCDNYIPISESVAIYIKASHPESCGLDIILALFSMHI